MILALLLLACRPDPGNPKYVDPDPWVQEGDDFYPDPLGEGEERLAYGLFYEGAATESLILDGENHFYIYSNTFSVEITDDRWEGYVADELVNQGVGWWGGGIHWDVARDISGWDTLHVALRSDALDDWDLAMTGGGTEARVAVASAGMIADGEWHVLRIPLADFEEAGADLTSVTVGVMMLGDSGFAGDAVAIDGLYLSRGL